MYNISFVVISQQNFY